MRTKVKNKLTYIIYMYKECSRKALMALQICGSSLFQAHITNKIYEINWYDRNEGKQPVMKSYKESSLLRQYKMTIDMRESKNNLSSLAINKNSYQKQPYEGRKCKNHDHHLILRHKRQ